MNSILSFIEGPPGTYLLVISAQVGFPVLVLSMIWLTIVAAGVGKKWALFVFFVPVVGPFCLAYKYWAAAKNAFMLYGIALLLYSICISLFILRGLIALFFTSVPPST